MDELTMFASLRPVEAPLLDAQRTALRATLFPVVGVVADQPVAGVESLNGVAVPAASPRHQPPSERPARGSPSRRRVALSAAIIAALGLGGLWLAASNREADRPSVPVTPPTVTVATTPNTPGSTTPPSTAPSTVTPTTASLSRSGVFPPQPAGVPWPTEEWHEAAWPSGVDQAAVDAATDVAFADGAAQRVRGVVIVHGGALVYERYSPHREDGPNEVMPSFSMAKSVTSALIGILVRDGRLDISQPAPVPEWRADPADPRAAITIEHMLQMATGMEWEDGYAEEGTTMSEMLASDDMAAYAAAQQPTSEPGVRFDYNSGTTTLLARVIGDSIGGDADDTRAFLDDQLFNPLGMDPVSTQFDAAGTWAGAFSADTTARDYAKFGLLYLRGGEWDGQQILPEEWVEFTRTPSAANPEYGAHWWLDPLRPGVSYAVGLHGQVITVDPAHDLVIVQLSTVGGSLALDHTEAILNAFAALDDGP